MKKVLKMKKMVSMLILEFLLFEGNKDQNLLISLDYDDDTDKDDEESSNNDELNRHENNEHHTKIIINSIKKAIYNALSNYLDAPLKDALLASLLDSRFKKMNRWPDEIRISTISLLRKEYLLIKGGETTTSQRNTRSV